MPTEDMSKVRQERVRITASVPPDLDRRIRDEAVRRLVSVNFLTERALSEFLEAHEGEQL